jgi:tyrosyl-tRNA synthetase
MKELSFINFARDVGKRITVNYMILIVKRLAGGRRNVFTEFTYQLIQGYDFYHLHKNTIACCKWGSDQWGILLLVLN